MRTSRIRLRHVQPEDYDRLYEIESDPETLSTWRYRGVLPSLEEYESALWRQTMFLMVFELVDSGEIAGYLHLYDVDLRAGHGWMSLYAAPDYRGRGTGIEALFLFADWVFANTQLRWMYAHAYEMNFGPFKSGERFGVSQHVGSLRERVEVDGQLTDVHVVAIGREQWFASSSRARLHRLQARLEAKDTASGKPVETASPPEQ